MIQKTVVDSNTKAQLCNQIVMFCVPLLDPAVKFFGKALPICRCLAVMPAK